MNSLVVLNYHGIESAPGEYPWSKEEHIYVIAKAQWIFQMDEIFRRGFSTLSLKEANVWLEGQSVLQNPLMLTFDDGLVSHYEHALPILKKLSLKAVFFVSAGFVGQKGFMNWSELKGLIQQGFEVGSHGLNHVPLTDLPEAEILRELEESKKMLEDRLGTAVSSFSVPRGFFRPQIQELASKAGYQFLFTSRFDVNMSGQNPLSLNRLAIRPDLSLERFCSWIHGRLGAKRFFEKIKQSTRETLSPAIYMAASRAVNHLKSMGGWR